MFIQSFAVKLKRYVHVACNRSLVSALSPLAHAASSWRDAPLTHALIPTRALDCAVLGVMAGAIALVALLCAGASRLDFAQAWRVGCWLP
ncbi:hypothetical protein NUV26_24035 [Burkholderia pseudomultivorans]|uniref:hypothetical protein n=1 Tax=Burkholderia TaxID=32008 RepID=UPI00075AED9B|nr:MULTISPECIES: hypothetical protein [Burkholderia]KVC24539.1 hypothetical protein WS55_17795 [Burkholderia pseudomultivorans]KVC25478.1 hypothetical protein WS56_28145 [Burkholderia pseudomultivorans]KVC45563.1 hypothetical protein WS58_13615 [Burkholderia pseudomultivorans]MDS0795246.1 hypothetical protein [Burkholderia pseudomultivorans]CAJ3197893.1 Uncharacterised protein [Burkholderia pseudomallei]